MKRFTIAATIIQVFISSATFAQLADSDFQTLRDQSSEEGWTFTVGETEAAHRSLDSLAGFVVPTAEQLRGHESVVETSRSLPSSFDWRHWGACTPVKDQQACGGCFAFAALGTIESLILINDGIAEDLSEQWVISCTGSGNCVDGGFHGTAADHCTCSGGSTDFCGNSGAVLEQEFPFVAWDTPCTCPYTHPYCISNWFYIGSTNAQIKQAIYDYGPVSVSMGATSAFQAYSGGVFNQCAASGLNHSVVLVGWDDNQGTSGVWFLRNSWGTRWGEDQYGNSWDPDGDGIQDNEGGYARIEFDCALVGQYPTYVTYNDSSSGVWVDFQHPGAQTGSFWTPYTSVSSAVAGVDSGGVVQVKQGSYAEAITISKPLTLMARGGIVAIGQ